MRNAPRVNVRSPRLVPKALAALLKPTLFASNLFVRPSRNRAPKKPRRQAHQLLPLLLLQSRQKLQHRSRERQLLLANAAMRVPRLNRVRVAVRHSSDRVNDRAEIPRTCRARRAVRVRSICQFPLGVVLPRLMRQRSKSPLAHSVQPSCVSRSRRMTAVNAGQAA